MISEGATASDSTKSHLAVQLLNSRISRAGAKTSHAKTSHAMVITHASALRHHLILLQSCLSPPRCSSRSRNHSLDSVPQMPVKSHPSRSWQHFSCEAEQISETQSPSLHCHRE